MNDGLDAIFRGARVPEWLRRFEIAPVDAVGELVVGRASLGTLGMEEPSVLLGDWLIGLGEVGGFAGRVDRALADWIDRSWGHPELEQALRSPALTAIAWCRIATIISMDERMIGAADRLRLHIIDDPRFLDDISQGRARDPMGLAWMALARFQFDRGLVDRWWNLCSVPPNEPWYRCGFGVHGLRGLPSANSVTAGRFPEEVAEGLALLAWGLRHRVDGGWLDEPIASEEFTRVARLTIAAYPFPNDWRSFWRLAIERDERRGRPPVDWVRKLVRLPDLEKGPGEVAIWKSEGRGRRGLAPRWSRSVEDIEQRLISGVWDALDDAQTLIEEQTFYARTTGNTYYIERTALKLGKLAQRRRPDLTLEWTDLVIKLTPWNVQAWTLNASTLRKMNRLDEALLRATQAVQRFPDKIYARNELAAVLNEQGRLEEAEAIYRELIERFPADNYARNLLAEMFRSQGRLEAAEAIYRETTERFPSDLVPWNGLGVVLKELGRLEEAEAIYRELIERFPGDKYARNGLGVVLKELGRLEEAEAIYRELIERFPADNYAWNGLGVVLKELGRLEAAEAVYREATERFPGIYQLRHGLLGVLKSQGRLTEQVDVYRAAIERAPTNVYARMGLATTFEALHRTAEAEVVYREAIEHFPDDIPLRNALAQLLRGQGRLEEPHTANRDQPTSDRIPTKSQSKLVEPDRNELKSSDLCVLLTDAYLLRRWASQLRTPLSASVELPTGSLRERAYSVLERLISCEETQAGAAVEAGLLKLTFGELDEAIELLRNASQRFPNNPRIRYTFARAVRAQAQEKHRRLSVEAEKEVIAPWHRLGKLNEASRPLQYLGEGRAWLALTDGATVEDKARDALGRLGYWINTQNMQQYRYPRMDISLSSEQPISRPSPEMPGDSFYGWWAGEVQAHVFGTSLVRSASDLSDIEIIRERFLAKTDLLDRIEEEYVLRLDQT